VTTQGALFAKPTALEEAIQRAETDWQRTVMREWGVRNPKPMQIHAGALGVIELVPTPCHCVKCETPAVIFPGAGPKVPESQGYCLCPRCSLKSEAPQAVNSVTGTAALSVRPADASLPEANSRRLDDTEKR
jgi:hypothetical protein